MFAESTRFTVTPIGSDSEEYQALVKEAAGKTILGVYELSLDGAVKDGSKIQVTFAVDEQYNGQSILILHYPKADDVTYMERHVATAQDGTVTVEVDSLSPVVIALDEESAGNDASGGQVSQKALKNQVLRMSRGLRKNQVLRMSRGLWKNQEQRESRM